MNKIAIVGHPSAESDALAHRLAQRGLAPAQPSKRERLSPTQITATLCQAHQVAVHQPHLDPKTPVAPLNVGAVWHGLALDLLLGNLDQNAWYWADPRTVFVLDYWRDADPELGFILLYDDPAQALLLETSDPSPQAVLDQWVAYNRVLLSFYHRHRQRCLLVHARQACQAIDHHWQTLLDVLPLAEASPSPAPSVSKSIRDQALQPLVEVLSQLGADDDQLHHLTASPIESYLTADLLASHPASAQLYEELQATANVPWDGEMAARPQAAQAWQVLLQQRQQITELLCQLVDQQQTLTAQLKQEQDSRAKAQAELTAQLKQEQEATAKAKAELKAQLEQHQTHNAKELEEENELLLLQLHQVQEELERYFLENQQLKQGAIVQAPASKQTQAHYGAAERIKRQLTYRLGAIMVSHSKKPADWVRMPSALLREVKQFNREKPEREATKLPPIHTYADAHEAERVKRHLSYRLGEVLMKHSRSPQGWLTMPWAMRKAVGEFRAERGQVGK